MSLIRRIAGATAIAALALGALTAKKKKKQTNQYKRL